MDTGTCTVQRRNHNLRVQDTRTSAVDYSEAHLARPAATPADSRLEYTHEQSDLQVKAELRRRDAACICQFARGIHTKTSERRRAITVTC